VFWPPPLLYYPGLPNDLERSVEDAGNNEIAFLHIFRRLGHIFSSGLCGMLPKADHIAFGVRNLGIEARVADFLLGEDRFAASPLNPLEVVIDGGDVDVEDGKLVRFGSFLHPSVDGGARLFGHVTGVRGHGGHPGVIDLGHVG
jgi:hypothetical protein